MPHGSRSLHWPGSARQPPQHQKGHFVEWGVNQGFATALWDWRMPEWYHPVQERCTSEWIGNGQVVLCATWDDGSGDGDSGLPWEDPSVSSPKLFVGRWSSF